MRRLSGITEEVRRLVLFSVRIGTCMLPTEYSYTKIYGNFREPVFPLAFKLCAHLAYRGRLRCYPTYLDVTLLL